MKKALIRYQLILFFLLTFLVSWFPWYTGKAAEILAVGPSLAAFAVVLLTGGLKGFLDLLKPFVRVRSSLLVWIIAVVGSGLMYLVGIGIYMLVGGEPPPFIMIRQELNLIPLYLILVVLMPWNGPVGEEFGWRGFALPRMQQKLGPLLTSLLLGFIWGVWHLPSFFNPNGVTGNLAGEFGTVLFLVIYTAGTIANSVFMTWLYNKSKRSALIAGVIWHAGINFWAPILLSDSSLRAAQDGSHLPTIPAGLYLTAIGVQVFAAIVLIVSTKGALAYELEKLQDA